ncbi:MAG: elongation factor Ts [Candidatus Pacebacteria bacterium]|nr:elongation factor Ts [Candidatus Paceibacterota bacterium]
MAITTEDIKLLREKTGVSVIQCKKALEEADGDMEKALLILKKKSAEIVEKKSDRELGGGVVQSYIHGNKKIGCMIELLCETDFVANNEEFQTLAYDIAMHVTAMRPEFLTANDISEEKKSQVEALCKEEVANLDKPEEIKGKILEGKIQDFFKARTLMEQPFVKNPDMTIKDLINEAVQKFGEKIQIGRFACYSLLE